MKWILYCAVISWILFSCVVTEEIYDWPMFMHDPQHSGYSTSSMPACLKKSWEYSKYSDSLDALRSVRFIASGGKLIVVQDPHSIYSLDVNDGSFLWETSHEDISLHVPAAAHGRVHIGMYEGILCLDAHTGDILWKYSDTHVLFQSSPIVFDEYLVIGSCQGFIDVFGLDSDDILRDAKRKQKRLLCLNAKTGEVVWEFFAHGTVDASPAYFEGKIYMNDRNKRIYCVDAETGELIWEKEMDGISSSSLSVDEEKIFIGTRDGILDCRARETGDILWKFDCGNDLLATPALGYGKVYFGSENGIFYCLDAQSGELIWKIETESKIYSVVVVADKKVAFGTRDGGLYIVDAFSGKVIDSHHLKGGISSLVLSDGKLFVGESSGRITCFEETPCNQGLILIGVTIAVITGFLIIIWMRCKQVKT